MANRLLDIRNLTKSFGSSKVLDRVGFQIREGEILGLIGPNGSGKTTLMEGVAGILPCDSGEVLLSGEVLSNSQKKKHLVYMPESMLPYGEQKVSTVIGFFAKLCEVSPERMDFLLGALELGPILEKRVRTLSKGFRRRLLVLIALFTKEDILFLDEPFDGLDHRQTLSLMKLLRKIRDEGRTLFLAIHQLNDAAPICDRLVLLSGGKVLAEGTMEELRKQAKLPEARLEEIFLALT